MRITKTERAMVQSTPEPDSACIATDIGVRQGCACGAMVFNAVYEVALADFRQQFRERGIAVKLDHDKAVAPWSTFDEGNEVVADPDGVASVEFKEFGV